jgi:hypothetical protein
VYWRQGENLRLVSWRAPWPAGTTFTKLQSKKDGTYRSSLGRRRCVLSRHDGYYTKTRDQRHDNMQSKGKIYLGLFGKADSKVE